MFRWFQTMVFLFTLPLALFSATTIKNPYYRQVPCTPFVLNQVEYIPLEGAMRFPNSVWGSIGYAREGYVYAIVCDHISDAAIYEYHTKTGKLFTLGTLSQVLKLRTYALRQPKVHTPLLQYEKNGLIYFGTDAGDPSEGAMYDHHDEGYAGGFFASLDPVSKEIKNLGQVKPHSGFKSLLIDQKHGLVYSTSPSDGYLIQYNIAKDTFDILGHVNGQETPRTLFQDPWSNVYSCTETAELFRFNFSKNSIEFLPVKLPGQPVTGPSQVVYGPDMSYIYGVVHYSGFIFKYTPEQNGPGKVDSLFAVGDSGKGASIRNLNGANGKLYFCTNGKEEEEKTKGDTVVVPSQLIAFDPVLKKVEKRVLLDASAKLIYGHPVSDQAGYCYTAVFMDNQLSTKYEGKRAICHLIRFHPNKL